MKIECYGDYKERAPCPDKVLIDFPRRMREWLSEVMMRAIAPPVLIYVTVLHVRTKMDRPADKMSDDWPMSSKGIDSPL